MSEFFKTHNCIEELKINHIIKEDGTEIEF